MPGEDVASDVVNSAWDKLPPEAAALFIVLLIILVGGIWLATTYMKTYGAREDKPAPEKEDPPVDKDKIGSRTLSLIQGLTASHVHEARQDGGASLKDEAQDVRIDAMQKEIDRLDEEIKTLRKWREEKQKMWAKEKEARAKDESARTADFVRLSNRIAALEMAAGERPGGSGVTMYAEEDDEEEAD